MKKGMEIGMCLVCSRKSEEEIGITSGNYKCESNRK